MTAPSPSATTRLATTPLPRLLVHAFDRKLTGTLVIEAPDGHRSAVYFERGAPAKVRSGLAVHRLGALLCELGVGETPVVEAALHRAVAERRLLGQVLVTDGKLTRSDLGEALREQIRRKIGWMCELPGASVAGFYEPMNLLEKWGAPESFQVAPLPLLWSVVRDHGNDETVDAVLDKLGDRTLRLHREAQVAGFHFTRGEQAVIDVMRAKPQPLAELEACGVLPRAQARRLVYALGLSRQLDLGSQAPPPLGVDAGAGSGAATHGLTGAGASTRPRSARPGQTPQRRGTTDPTSPATPPTEELAALAAEIRARAEALPRQTLYEILGVDVNADTSVIQGAFFQLARRWHPDRIPAAISEEKALATGVFARMTEAHGVLTDAERRAEYGRLLREGGATGEEQEKVTAVLRAAAAFQRAEIFVRRQKLAEAEREAKVAADGDDEQPEYAALYAWIRGQQIAPGGGEAFAPLLRILDDAVAKEPDRIRIRELRAQLLKRAGREDLAVRDYKHIVGLRPSHTDALRELRLYRMRRPERGRAGSSSPPGGTTTAPRGATSPGFLGKFFKR